MVHTEPPVRRSLCRGRQMRARRGFFRARGPRRPAHEPAHPRGAVTAVGPAPGQRASDPSRRSRPPRVSPPQRTPARAPSRPSGAPDGDAGRIQWNPLSEWMDLL